MKMSGKSLQHAGIGNVKVSVIISAQRKRIKGSYNTDLFIQWTNNHVININ